MALDLSRAIPIASAAVFDSWLAEHGDAASDLVIAIYKKSSGEQTVTYGELLETGLCHGWIDTQAKRIDDERYGSGSCHAARCRIGRSGTGRLPIVCLRRGG